MNTARTTTSATSPAGKYISVTIDVMIHGGRTFYKQLHYKHCSLYRFDNSALSAMAQWIADKLPSVNTRSDVVCYCKMPSGEEAVISFNQQSKRN
jgi:hypothetical protein